MVGRDVGRGGEEDRLWNAEVQLEERDDGDDGLGLAGARWLRFGGRELAQPDPKSNEET